MIKELNLYIYILKFIIERFTMFINLIVIEFFFVFLLSSGDYIVFSCFFFVFVNKIIENVYNINYELMVVIFFNSYWILIVLYIY